MLRLSLAKVSATLTNFNPRVEKEGTDKIPAADLKLSFALGSESLREFESSLEAFLFNEKSLDLIGGKALRDPHMVFPLKRDEEMTGAVVEISYGVGAPMKFADCKVNQWSIDPQAGGSVIYEARVQCRPSGEEAGKLYELQEQKLEFSLTPAELPTIDDKASKKKKEKDGAAKGEQQEIEKSEGGGPATQKPGE